MLSRIKKYLGMDASDQVIDFISDLEGRIDSLEKLVGEVYDSIAATHGYQEGRLNSLEKSNERIAKSVRSLAPSKKKPKRGRPRKKARTDADLAFEDGYEPPVFTFSPEPSSTRSLATGANPDFTISSRSRGTELSPNWPVPKNEEAPGEPTMMAISSLSKAWGCSRNFLWSRCKSGEIPAKQIGNRWFIPISWIREQELHHASHQATGVSK